MTYTYITNTKQKSVHLPFSNIRTVSLDPTPCVLKGVQPQSPSLELVNSGHIAYSGSAVIATSSPSLVHLYRAGGWPSFSKSNVRVMLTLVPENEVLSVVRVPWPGASVFLDYNTGRDVNFDLFALSIKIKYLLLRIRC